MLIRIYLSDLPQDVSSMTAYKDGYEDILNDRRDKSDVGYAMKTRTDVPQYKYTHPRSATKLKEDVISSDRVRYTIEKVNKNLPVSGHFGFIIYPKCNSVLFF